MSDVKITVGGPMEQQASQRFVEAWRRAERGETFDERHLAFESWGALARVLTAKRMELLRHVRHHNVMSVRGLAKALGRDYSNVHADVRALSSAELLDAGDGGLHNQDRDLTSGATDHQSFRSSPRKRGPRFIRLFGSNRSTLILKTEKIQNLDPRFHGDERDLGGSI